MTNNDEEPPKAAISIGGGVKDSIILNGNNNDVTVHRNISQWWTIGIILLGLTIASLSIIYVVTLKTPQSKVSDFPIAVAGFAEYGTGLPNKIGDDVAERIFTRLYNNLEVNPVDPDGPTISVQGPDTIGVIAGETRDIRAKKASELAKSVNASIVIYGVVTGTENGITITPELFIAHEGITYDGAEITGQYGLSIALPLEKSTEWNYEFNQELLIASRVIQAFASGLSAYSTKNYSDALKKFEETEKIFLEHEQKLEENGKTEGITTLESKKTLYALMGFTASKVGERSIDEKKKQEMFVLSQQKLEASIKIDPEYARPYIGLASLAYLRALQPVTKSENDMTKADFSQIKLCDSWLTSAENATHKPPLAEVETKIHFQRGQCYMLEILSGYRKDSFQKAKDEFDAVITAYGNGANENVKEFAAEAHARLAVIYTRIKNPNLQKASEEYQIAAELMDDISKERADHFRNDANLVLTPAAP